jgi:glycine cleavage system transcriptional repressor
VARPSANENVVLLLASVPQPTAALLPLARRVNECGCTIVEARVSCLGQETVVALLVAGPWDAMAKLESAVARLEREDDLKVEVRRTTIREPQANLMPYVVEVVAADRPGALFQLSEFFATRGIAIEQLVSSRYRAMQTGADMFSAQITIGIPAKTHIAALRDDFLEFCDAQNLDAIMDPMKF